MGRWSFIGFRPREVIRWRLADGGDPYALAAEAVAGRIDPAGIDEAALASRLDTHGLPDPELVIRTSGETRISNFLLWQAAYAEFVFAPVMWPDFDRAAFEDALAQYRQRERRFGGLSAPADRSVDVA